MIKSMRIFNADKLFKLSLGIIIAVVVCYIAGFALGVTVGKSNDGATSENETVAEEYGDSAAFALYTICGIVGFMIPLAINGTAINSFYKISGSKYARTLKHGEMLFCRSVSGAVLLSLATAAVFPLVIGVISLALVVISVKDILPLVLFSLGASLLFNILIRPLIGTKTANGRTALLVVSIFIDMTVISATTTATGFIGYTAALIASIILTVIGAVGTVISLISSCNYIKKNWLF